jgi:RimJ/RimL family protein N-acetyltransferase
VARYVRLEDTPDAAEVAVAVTDDWQGRGVATALLDRLRKRALASGLARFRASSFAWNHEAIDQLTRLGASPLAHTDPGVLELEMELREPDALNGALRGAAADELQVRGPSHPSG